MEIRLLRTISGRFTRIHPTLVVIIFFSVAFSCKKNDEKPPAGILSKPQMVNVLTEIYIAEEKVNRLGVRRDSAEVVFKLMEGKVFDKTGISDSVFAASLDYYVDRPKEFELIYTALVDSLQLKEQRAPARRTQDTQ
jgi:hypothetical protein